MGSIKVLLWDIDGTILNFDAAEEAAILKGFKNLKLGECTSAMLKDYKEINKGYWQKLEKGLMTKPEILVHRFIDFFTKYGIDISKAEEFNFNYQVDLGDTVCFNDDAYNIVKSLKGRVLQYAVTNGTKVAQKRKLKASGIGELLDGVFISDEIGVEKPNKAFFDMAFEKIAKDAGDIKLSEIMIIGDSLTSDIKGGNNAGIITCWYNKENNSNDLSLKIDYEINDLGKLYEILEMKKE